MSAGAPRSARSFSRPRTTAVAVSHEAPERWSRIEADVRHCLLSRLPYATYYRVLPDHLRIPAFKHHSRHPDTWRFRLAD